MIPIFGVHGRRFAQVMNHGARRRDGLRMPREAESVQRRHAELFPQHPFGVVEPKDPFVDPRLDAFAKLRPRRLGSGR